MITILEQVPLADKNWFRTGGPARFYCEPTTAEQMSQAVQWAQEHAQEIFVLGEGANLLISDDGFDGLVIRPQIKNIEQNDNLVTAGAGLSVPELITWCLEHKLLGLEEFSGIPGTVGGSVFINIHYFEFLLSKFLVSATVVEKATGRLMTVDPAWFNFGYNYSTLHEHQHYLVDATFTLTPCTDLEAAYAHGRSVEIIRHRARRYPTARTCGSFFRNFFDSEIHHEINGKKVPFVAYYLDKIGVKGALRSGNAVVSYLHANMLVTETGATSSDVINLARTMQQMVFDQFGLIPHAECQFIGFKEYPVMSQLQLGPKPVTQRTSL